MKLDGSSCPHGPVAKQTPNNMNFLRPGMSLDAISSEQVYDDSVVIAGVERDVVLASRFADGTDDVEGLITVEGGDLDGKDVLIFCKPAPERIGEDYPADGRLKVKPKYGQYLGHFPAVLDQLGHRRIGQRGEAKKAGMIPGFRRKEGFL